ncbi:hypothetical protein [Cupriavidus basilensis]|uniref:hypothetical protein n=1 Tax=Cupriavidus basilensis TaxID=68895 RepID=UPI0028488F0A|nr:hypothetical protein [Cupriavidus basilensis]MDR3383615.1 hypothetical protein [Cupriavidus basilensis]
MRTRFGLILCAWQCALLLGGATVAGPAVAQATVTPIDLAAPAARALDEPSAPAASAPPAQAAREASAASAAQAPAKASGAVSGNLVLTLGGAVVLVAIATMLQRARRRRRPPSSK